MPISGKSFQLNIASTLSFQLRAGFAAVRQDPNPESRLEQRKAEATDELRENATDAEWSRQSPFYEVVGPYVDSVPATQRRSAPATITALPVHENTKAALMSAQSTSGNYYAQKSAQEYGEFANSQMMHTHSYRQNGQRVPMMTQTPIVDFFV